VERATATRVAADPPDGRLTLASAGPATAVPRGAGRPRLAGPARGYLFVAPALAYLTLTALYPLGAVVSMSVQDVVAGHWRFAGGQQYLHALGDGLVWNSVRNTATFTLASTALHLLLGLGLALLLNAPWFSRTLRNVVRGLLILPWLFSTAASALMWALLYHPFGLFNYFWVGVLGQPAPIQFLGSPATALWAIIAVNTWKSYPFYMVSLLGGLQGIPLELYDAAKVDGAGGWQRFRFVTLPQLRPVLVAISTIDVITSFGHVDLIAMLTRGGPGVSTETVAHYVYRTALLDGNLPYGSAISTLMLVILTVFTVVYLRVVAGRQEIS
jgi:multiple sugar transport system permease protein